MNAPLSSKEQARAIRARLEALLRDAYALEIAAPDLNPDWGIAVGHLARAGGAMKRGIENGAER